MGMWEYPTVDSITAEAAEIVAVDECLNLTDEGSAQTKILSLFKSWDQDGDGMISIEELAQVFADLGEEITEDHIRVIFPAADKDNDGKLNYEEFIAWIYCAGEEDFDS